MAGKLSAFFCSHTVAVLISTTSVIAVVGGLVFFYFFAPLLQAGTAQPIPFSHRIHVTVKEIDCRFCHYSVERSPHAGLPSTTKCLYCHKYIIPEHPFIRELTDEYHDQGRPVQWRKIVWLPDHVYFSHQRHIQRDVECAECHGPVESMDRVSEVHRFKMGFCLKCHQKRKASEDCWACHK